MANTSSTRRSWDDSGDAGHLLQCPSTGKRESNAQEGKPMTHRFHIIIGVVGFLLLALLFVRIPLMNAIIGRVPAPTLEDKVAGQWVGTIAITGVYSPEVFGKTAGHHRRGAMKFVLKEWDTFIPRYAGPGELYIYGEGAPRKIKSCDLQLDPDGSIRVKVDTTPDLGWAYGSHGHTDGTTMTWNTNNVGLAFSGTFTHGTDADYQKLVEANQ